MYLYSFNRFFGGDKVCKIADDFSYPIGTGKKTKKIVAGDLLIFGEQYFLVLGETISFSEQYLRTETIKPCVVATIYPGFLTLPTLKLFHWMVEMYYTTYKSVVRLFFSADMEDLLKRESKLNRGKPNISAKKIPLKQNKEAQTLIIFPDLRTLYNETGRVESNVKKGMSDERIILLASSTQNQKDIHRWEIKKGIKSVIFCTYSEIFQDFNNLKKIIFVDPHKRYYASQQDPRYKVADVLRKLVELHGAVLEIVEV